MDIREKIARAARYGERHTYAARDVLEYFQKVEAERDAAQGEARAYEARLDDAEIKEAAARRSAEEWRTRAESLRNEAEALRATLARGDDLNAIALKATRRAEEAEISLKDVQETLVAYQRRLSDMWKAFDAERARAAKLEAEAEKECEAKQRTVDAWTECAKERNAALEQVGDLQARAEEDAEEIIRLRDAYDDQSAQLRRLREQIDVLTGPSAPKPSFGCVLPGVPSRVVYGPHPLQVERDLWIERVRELENQLRRVREIVR